MSPTSDDGRVYTFFHEDGLFRLTEAELVNDYMRLRELESRAYTTDDTDAGLTETHRWKAPGVWLPRDTTPPCGYEELIGPTLHRCDLARGHEGEHRDRDGSPIYPAPTFHPGPENPPDPHDDWPVA